MSMGGPNSQMSQASPQVPFSASQSGLGVGQQTGGTTAGLEENLPPWLWPPTTGSNDLLNVPNQIDLEDIDVNMDEGFDWQTWQERLGRYEVSGGGWGPGL